MINKKTSVIFLILITIIISGCKQKEAEEDNLQIVNPASLHCEETGGKLTIAEDAEGSKGICHFDDGSFCEEWAYFNKKCQKGDSLKEVFSGPPILLEDVSGGDASGEAWLKVENNVTFHKVVAKNMPRLKDNEFYEGWLVKKSTNDFFSTGQMFFDTQAQTWILDYQTEGDKSNYTKVVITLEPNDGDPAPAKHIIEN